VIRIDDRTEKEFDFQNGNATVRIYKDGTREVEWSDGEDLKLDWPLNIDVRLTNNCPFGRNPLTGKAVCEYCHESATTDGISGNVDQLIEVLSQIPEGIATEIAIGANNINGDLDKFLAFLKDRGLIANLTVNHLMVKHAAVQLLHWLDSGMIRGLGISYRKDYPQLISAWPDELVNHPNVILHCIAGIDTLEEVMELPFQKILILGYKYFGFGKDYFDAHCLTANPVSDNLSFWRVRFPQLLKAGKLVCMDNLAIEQLEPRRFFSDRQWNEMYQGEHSFYINAVTGTFSPSSRSDKYINWNDVSLKEYFHRLESKL
jgi:hypothetical protein